MVLIMCRSLKVEEDKIDNVKDMNINDFSAFDSALLVVHRSFSLYKPQESLAI